MIQNTLQEIVQQDIAQHTHHFIDFIIVFNQAFPPSSSFSLLFPLPLFNFASFSCDLLSSTDPFIQNSTKDFLYTYFTHLIALNIPLEQLSTSNQIHCFFTCL